MKINYYIISILLLMISICVNSQNKFKKRKFVNSKNKTLLYNIYIPKDYVKNFHFQKTTSKLLVKNSNTKKYPLVVFLHGSGERGNDNKSQLIHGVKHFASSEKQQKFPSIIIAPQCPKGKRWVELSWKLDKHIMPTKPSEPIQLTVELIDYIINKYRIDTNRIYITGLSMGGFGAWDIISRYPDKFAAAVPICGGGDENMAKKISHIPIWAFHGSKDVVVSVSRTRNMIKAIKDAGGNPKYTEYPNVSHFSWKDAYLEKDLYKWIFEQKITK